MYAHYVNGNTKNYPILKNLGVQKQNTHKDMQDNVKRLSW